MTDRTNEASPLFDPVRSIRTFVFRISYAEGKRRRTFVYAGLFIFYAAEYIFTYDVPFVVIQILKILVSILGILGLLQLSAAVQRAVVSTERLDGARRQAHPAPAPMTRAYVLSMSKVVISAYLFIVGLVSFLVFLAAAALLAMFTSVSGPRDFLEDVVLHAALCAAGATGLWLWRRELGRAPVLSFFGTVPETSVSDRRLGLRMAALTITSIAMVVLAILSVSLAGTVMIALVIAGMRLGAPSIWPWDAVANLPLAFLDVLLLWAAVRVVAGGTARLHVVIDGPVQAPPAATAPA